MRTDIKKDRKDLYLPGRTDFTEVDVPAITYLAIDGHGDPNTSPAYAIAIQALYAGAYAIRSALKKRTGDDFVVGPLEGLWTSADDSAFVARDKGEWDWTMMIPLPDAVSSQDIVDGLGQAARKKPELPIAALKELPLNEGRSRRSSTWAPTTTRPPPWPASTTRSCRDSDSPGTGPITRSTSATPGAWRRRR